jgi:hypothetical protein
VNWEAFETRVPELAKLGEDRLLGPGVGLLGTLRRDGRPRISPCEIYIVDGELLLGMMWQSRKALDLLRDSRVVVHSTVTNRDGAEGDFKLYGRARNVDDPSIRERYADTLEAAIDWRPSEPYHLFAVDIESAGFAVFGDDPHALSWDPERELRRLPISGS